MTYYSKEEIRSRCFRKDGKISRHTCPEILTFMHSTFPDLKNVKSMIRAYVFNNESDKCEKRLADTIEKTFNVTVIRNDRKVLNGKEIDIWIPEHNLGIEYNGICWHSSDEAKKADHNKMIPTDSASIKLLQFWCYEVDNEIDKVLEIISGNFV